MPSFSSRFEEGLHRALEYANERNHEYAMLEHLLLALIDDSDAARVMSACGVDLNLLRAKLTRYLDKDLTSVVSGLGAGAQPTAAFQRVIHRAVVHVQSAGREEVTGANVLVGLFAERESHAVYLLNEQGMTRFDAVNFISHGVAKQPGAAQPEEPVLPDDDLPPIYLAVYGLDRILTSRIRKLGRMRKPMVSRGMSIRRGRHLTVLSPVKWQSRRWSR